jgi:hypothetical protein
MYVDCNDHHNHYYGQAHILARYCGLDDEFPSRIRGYLQHGWSAGCGWNPVHEFFDGAWRFVWSDAPRCRGLSLGRRNYHLVGAPWLDLMDLEPDLGRVLDEKREGTLWVLFHSWEGGNADGRREPALRRHRPDCRLWPEMYGKEVDVKVAREIADHELGRPWMMSPAENQMLFDWNERD